MENNTITIPFDEKKEMIIDSYCKSYDKDLAYSKCGLTKEEINLLEKDSFFQERLIFYKSEHREKLISKLEDLTTQAAKDEVKLKSLIKLGEIIHPEVFSNTQEQKDLNLVLPVETQKRLKEVFSSGSIESLKSDMMDRLLQSNPNSDKIIDEIIN